MKNLAKHVVWASLAAGCAAGAMGADGNALLKVGILSDVHIHAESDLPVFARALEHFRDNHVDAVLIAGDMADTGETRQLEMIGRTWSNIFPGNKDPDGRPVEKLFVYGNHDLSNWGDVAQPHVFSDPAGNWEKAFGEKYEPIWLKRVKDYVFVGAHWGQGAKLAEFIEAHRGELEGANPFFYTQHDHPGNTVNGPWAWGNDGGRATRVLEKFPNAVAFSGHSHYSLTDEKTIWQGAFTSVGTSSLKYVFSQYGRENAETWGTRKLQMPGLPEHNGKQGLLMTVFAGKIVLERLEFVHGRHLGADWVIPLDGTRPYAFASRKAAVVAPEFASDAAVTVRCVNGKNRAGEKTEQVLVSFPAAKPSATSRVFDYEVRALTYFEDVDDVVLTRRVLAENFFLAPEMEAATGTCAIAAADLPADTDIVFAVRPVECFGNKGREIFSPVFRKESAPPSAEARQ